MEAMTCNQAAENLSVHLDGELSPEERTRIEAHLESCTFCLAQLDSARSLKHAIARLSGSEEPPGAVRARIKALRLTLPAHSFWRRLSAVSAVIGLLFIGVYAIRDRKTPAQSLGDELVSDYLHSLPEARPVDVASGDPDVVVRFFSGKTPFAPVVPLVPSGRLLGGRLCNLAGRHVELLFYRHALSQERFSLFICDHPIQQEGCSEYRGHPVCARRFGKLTVLAIGELPGDTLKEILQETAL
jgi:mycothiol system anti-sigma-R factor